MTVTAHLLATTGSPLIRYPLVVHSDKNDFILQFSPKRKGWNALSLSRAEIISVNSRYSFLLTFSLVINSIRRNTPAMPLSEAHFGGFFVSGVYQ